MHSQTILLAIADSGRRDPLAAHLDADGYTVHTADTTGATTSKLAAHAVDVLVLGPLERTPSATGLLRDLRAGALHARIHPAQLVVTLGATDEITTLRAYEAGSDHHLAADASYLMLRTVLAAVVRRVARDRTRRRLQVGELRIDTAARTADISGAPVYLRRTEFELLCQLASDPQRVFTKQQLMRAVWGHANLGRSRTLDSHAARLRHRLEVAGGHGFVVNRWGVGYCLLQGPAVPDHAA